MLGGGRMPGATGRNRGALPRLRGRPVGGRGHSLPRALLCVSPSAVLGTDSRDLPALRVATPFGLASEATLHESIDKSVVEALFIDSIDLVH